MPATLPLSSSLPKLCWQCHLRPAKRPRVYAQISQIAIRPTTGHNLRRRNYSSDARKRTYCLQHGRSLLSLDGSGATDFLHNLVPAPLLPLEDKPSCIASAFLNAKGRILHDVLVYKPAKNDEQRWLLDVDTNSAPAIMKLLKKHKLRSKFKLERLSPEQAGVFSLLPGSDGVELDGVQVLGDPRPEMGSRGYFLSDDATARLEAALAEQKPNEQQDFSDYLLHRMSYGHAEGPVEIQSEHALPQESNLDFYGGIDFHKGCYLGQELTIRTHHTGVVRKRILPVQIYNDEFPIDPTQNRPLYKSAAELPQPPNEANISKCGARGRSGKSTGKWLGGFGNIGLALCRLETMTSISVTAEGSSFQENDEFEVSWKEGETGDTKRVKVKAFVPSWLEEAIKKSIEARSTRSQKKRKELEEEENEVD